MPPVSAPDDTDSESGGEQQQRHLDAAQQRHLQPAPARHQVSSVSPVRVRSRLGHVRSGRQLRRKDKSDQVSRQNRSYQIGSG